MVRRLSRPTPRSAAAAVEFAFVLPFLLIVLLGVWEVGRLIQVQQILNNACREGARVAAQGHTINSTGAPIDIQVSTGTPNVKTTIINYLREAGIDTTNLQVTFAYTTGDTTLTQPSQGVKGQKFHVGLTLPFSNVRWTLLGLTSITTLNAGVDWESLVDDPFTIDPTIPQLVRGAAMIRSPRRLKPRRAAAMVEFAIVSIVAFLFLFGIFEYARYVFFLQVASNAAREGARYAVVHTGDGTTKQQVIDEVTARMAKRESELSGYTVDVLAVNANTGAALTGVNWNDAAFGAAIEVRITGTYTPILPTLLKTSTTINFKAYSMMSSEAN